VSRLRLLALTTGFIALAVSCGVPDSGEFEAENGEIPNDLDATTTSTTTSTTLPTTTIDATSTTIEATTSTAVRTAEVTLYFVSGSQIFPVAVQLLPNATADQVLQKLLAGPDIGEAGFALRTAIPPGAQITVAAANGVGTIDLPTDIFDDMAAREQRLVFAQLVLTIGSLGGIGPITFTSGGEPYGAIRGDGSFADPGQAVSKDDYAIMLTGQAPPVTTTSTSTTLAPAIETESTAADPGASTTIGG
jgi:hypothetical protein